MSATPEQKSAQMRRYRERHADVIREQKRVAKAAVRAGELAVRAAVNGARVLAAQDCNCDECLLMLSRKLRMLREIQRAEGRAA